MGQQTEQILDLLRRYESRNVTYMDPQGGWPIIWKRAQGVRVEDVEGKSYLDLTAAFGVAAAGHANPRVVEAGQKQMAALLHAMGDVHPHELKAQFMQALNRWTFERWSSSPTASSQESKPQHGKTILGNSGFESVEAALKTAVLATGKPGVIAFEGSYHGLGYGALNTTHREHFRAPFESQLARFGTFLSYPVTGPALDSLEQQIEATCRDHDIGAILAEPIQARGGIRVPASGFLSCLRKAADKHRLVLILDEIYTGFGRTGYWFACEHEGVVPDLICLGKAMTGGFPLSACTGRADLMDAAWPKSDGEAIHTSTFLGHPVGCAMALAQLNELEERDLPHRAAVLGEFLLSRLKSIHVPEHYCVEARGRGLLAGLELKNGDGTPATQIALALVKRMLDAGYLLLPEGVDSNVLGFTPPLTIEEEELAEAIEELEKLTNGT